MSAVDWIGFSGVMLLLSAYFLVAFNMIKPHGFTYIILNCVGAAIACLAAVLLHYIPFIILEGAWFIIAFVSLLKLKLKHTN